MHSLPNLLAGAIAFVGSHFALSHPLRPALTTRLGEARFTILYSIVAAITLTWFVMAAVAAPPTPLWWVASPGLWDLATLVMLLAAILLAGSLVGNPALVDPTLRPNIPAIPRGVLAITRHPMMWAFTLWAIVHVMLWGSAANLIVSASIGILAFFGARAQDGKKARLLGPAWQGWEAKTSFWPFGAQFTGRSSWRDAVPHALILLAGLAIWLIATVAHPLLGGPVAARGAGSASLDAQWAHLVITADIFRRLALAMPGAVEQSHMGHPDFRMGKRIFASLGYPNAGCAVLRLTVEQREMLVAAEPAMFSPVPGGWGKNGATILALPHADEATAVSALAMAADNLKRK